MIWHIEMFGGLRVRYGDRTTKLLTGKEGTLLACLTLAPSHCRTRLELATQIWSESSPPIPPDETEPTNGDAQKNKNLVETRELRNLSQVLYQLRQQIKRELGVEEVPFLNADRDFVAFAPEVPVTTEVEAFDKAIQGAKQATDDAQREEFLACAVTLYRGDLLPDYYQNEVISERNRLHVAYLSAGQELAEIGAKQGKTEQAIALVRRLLGVDPLEEASHELLVRLLLEAGRTQEAQRCYAEWEVQCQQAFGTAPAFVLSAPPAPNSTTVPRVLVAPLPKATPLPPPAPAEPPSLEMPPPAETIPLPFKPTTFWQSLRRRWWWVAVPMAVVVAFLCWSLWKRPAPLPTITLENAGASIQQLRQLSRPPVSETDSEQIARRTHHADLTLAIVEEAQAHLCGPYEGVWTEHLEAIESEMDSAFAWLLQHDPGKALQLSGALYQYRYRGGYTGQAKGRYWIEQALVRAPKSHSLAKARALYGYALVAVYLPQDGGLTEQRCQEALQICQQNADKRGTKEALRLLAVTYNRYMQYPQAWQHYELALQACRNDSDIQGQASVLLCMAHFGGHIVVSQQESHRRKAENALQSLKLFRQLQSNYGIGRALKALDGCAKAVDLPTPSGMARPYYEALIQEYLAQAQNPNFHASTTQLYAYRAVVDIASRLEDYGKMYIALKWFLLSDVGANASHPFVYGAFKQIEAHEGGHLLTVEDQAYLRQVVQSFRTAQDRALIEEGRHASLRQIAERIGR